MEIVFLVAGVVLGALSSWFITDRYYRKSSADQSAEIERLRNAVRPRNTLQDFIERLETGHWQHRNIDGVETWICDEDNTFQIESSNEGRDFAEPWTTVYPDRASRSHSVNLKIANVVIRELQFISMDGGRIFVPMAETRTDGAGNLQYLWNLNSLEVKVGRIIGTYYIYNDLEGVARRSGVVLTE